MTTDPFGTPGPVPLPDKGDPFGVPSDSGRATRMGDAEERAEVPRDQWDRYLMPHLDGTKPAANKGFTRVSTTKAALSNTFGIQDWAKRRVVEGIAKDPDLVAAALRASKMPDGKDKEKALRRVASAGFDLGGGKERSGLGTEFHELTESVNRGELVTSVDPKWNPELDAYTTMLYENSIRVRPEYLERQVLCPYNNAGTFDNIVEYWNPDTEEWELVVADLKTGRSLDLGWLEIEMQLWLYANAYGMWTTTNIVRNDPKDPTKITDVEGSYEPMPRELRQDKALIFHVPLDGTATLYVIDLSGVERYVKAAVEAKRANAEAKNKVRKISTYRPDAFVAQPNDAAAYPFDIQINGETATVAPTNIPPGPVYNETFTPTPTAPTPDAQAQIDKALERRIVAAKVLDKPAEPPPVERDPVTGRKKRTCGFCHLPGHTQKNCPSNPASAKYNSQATVDKVAEMSAPLLAADPAEEESSATYTPAVAPLHQDPPVSYDQKDHPFCLKTHPHPCTWTSQHPDAPGQWVCSVSGKPGKQAYELGQTMVTKDGPYYGAPAADGSDASLQVGDDAAPLAWSSTPVPSQDPAADPVIVQIAGATTALDVLRIRDTAMRAGTWIDATHDDIAKARYLSLQ